MPISALAFLILTAAIALLWSHYYLLWADEFGPLEAGSISSIGRLIHVQLTTPVSVEPLGYNVLIHVLIDLFGTSAFVVRLPSIFGYLLMQACLFYFVRRIASERVATFALALPALMGAFSYGVQARPYALLLGLSALAMLCWQTAARRDSRRTLALVGLALSLAMAVNTHYYGVLLFFPLCAAESVRVLGRRRVDIPVLASLLAGMAGMLVVMPFARALAQFRTQYAAGVNGADYHFITHSYLWILLGQEDLSVRVQHLIGFGIALLLVSLIARFLGLRSWATLQLPPAEAMLLLTFAALPFVGYLLGNLVLHFVQPRYILPTVVGVASILAILMAPLLRNKTIGRILVASLFVAIAGAGALHIRSARRQAQATMASLRVAPATQRKLAMFPGQAIYVLNPGVFAVVGYYSPDPDIRSDIALVYSQYWEMQVQHIGYLSRVAANGQAAGIRNIVPYESVSNPGTEHLFLLYHNPWDWTDQALAASHAQITYLGQFYGGALVSVRFP